MTDKTTPFTLDELSFDPEIKSIMGQAFVSACKALHDYGQPEVVNTLLAKRIIAIAKTKECDTNRNPTRSRRVRAF